MTEPVTAVVGAAQLANSVVKGAEESISTIRRLVERLRAQPDMAALKLSAAIDEVMKTYQAVDGAITSYGSLALDTDALTTRSRELLAIAGGSLEVEVENHRGHSQAIREIYDKYLFRWFDKVFNQTELQEMEAAFYGPNGLANADHNLFAELLNVAESLTAAASTVVPLAMAGDVDRARREIVDSYLALTPLQQAMAKSMRQMAALKNDFLELARAV
jgi:hypothetical protein